MTATAFKYATVATFVLSFDSMQLLVVIPTQRFGSSVNVAKVNQRGRQEYKGLGIAY